MSTGTGAARCAMRALARRAALAPRLPFLAKHHTLRLLQGHWLYAAARADDRPRIQALLAGNVDINALDLARRSALEGAVDGGHWPLLQWLLDRGADLRPAIRRLAARERPDHLFRLVDHLLMQPAPVQPMPGTAVIPAGIRPCSVPEILVRAETGRHLTAAIGRALAVAETGAECAYQSSCLHFAAATGRAKLVTALLDLGADPLYRNTLAETALTIALVRGHHHLAQPLIAAGADPTHALRWLRFNQEFLKQAPYARACRILGHSNRQAWEHMDRADAFVVLGSRRAIRLLEGRAGFCGGAHHIERNGDAFVMLRALPSYVKRILIENDPLYLRQYLMNMKWPGLNGIPAQLFDFGADGEPVIHQPFQPGDAFSALQDVDIPLDQRDAALPIPTATLWPMLKEIRDELPHWLSAERPQPPLSVAAYYGRADTVRELLAAGHPVDERNEFGQDALSVALLHSHLTIADLLLDHGARPDGADGDGITALARVAADGGPEALDWLLAKGATVDVTDTSGSTPLMVAAQRNRPHAILHLAAAGADIGHRNQFGQTALALAFRQRAKAAADALLDRGADFGIAAGKVLEEGPDLHAWLQHKYPSRLQQWMAQPPHTVLASAEAMAVMSLRPGFLPILSTETGEVRASIRGYRLPSFLRTLLVEDTPQYVRRLLITVHWESLVGIDILLFRLNELGEPVFRRFEPSTRDVDAANGFSLRLPLAAEIEPVNWCNLRCRYCHVSFTPEPKIFRLSEECMSNLDGLEGAFVQVGAAFEPTMHKNLPVIMDRLTEMGCETGFITNGTLLTDAAIDSLVRANLYVVQVSFDAGTPETYAHIRRRADFDRTVASIRKLKAALAAAGRKTILLLSVVLMRCNVNELRTIVDLAEELGVDLLGFQFLVLRFGEDPELLGDSLDPMLEEAYARLDDAAEYAISNGKRVVLSCPYFAHSPLADRFPAHFRNGLVVPDPNNQRTYHLNKYVVLQLGRHPRMSHNCVSPYTFARINADGDVSICRDFIIGNISQQSLRDIWFGDVAHMVREFLILNPSVCHICEHYKYCLQPAQMNEEAPQLLGNDMQYGDTVPVSLAETRINAEVIEAASRSAQAGALFQAVASGDFATIQSALEQGVAVDFSNGDGSTALHLAVRSRQAESLRQLLAHGADANRCDDRGRTPLVVAVGREAWAEAEILRAHGADINALLAYAVRHAQEKAVRYALSIGADPGRAGGNGPGLVNEALIRDLTVIASTLVRAGAPADIPDDGGVRPLHRAAILGDDHLVADLLKAGIDHSPLTPEDTTPLMLAALHGHQSAAELLVAAGASPAHCNTAGEDALLLALRAGRHTIAQLLLARGYDLERRDRFGLTPILRTARSGDAAGLRWLHTHGADIHAVDNQGNSTLIMAAIDGNKSLCNFLLSIGVDHNTTNHAGENAYMISIREGHGDLFQ